MHPTRWFAAACVLALATGPLQAQPAAPPPQLPWSDDSPLDVRADRHEVDPATGVWICDGNVYVSNALHVLRADHARVDTRSGEVAARGNVEISRPGLAVWRGESITYNYRTGFGLAGDGTLQVGRLALHAVRSRREPDGTLRLWDIEVTTCANPPGSRHYSIACAQATVSGERYVSARNATVRFLGLPIAWWPYWHYDLDRFYGLNLRPGYSSDWGPFLLACYDYPLAAGPGARLDGRTRLDYRLLRGWAFGKSCDWTLDGYGAGRLDLYYAADRKGPETGSPLPPVEREGDRGRIALAHVADLSPRDRVVVQAQWLSDDELLRDFFRRQYRDSVQPDNVAAYTRREDDLAAGIVVSGPIGGYYDGVSRTPEGWIEILPRELLPGVYYESQSRAGWLTRSADSPLTARDAKVETLRLDSAHRLTIPLDVGDVLCLTPRAGYRGTFYGASWDRDDGQVRNLFELGAEAALKIRGVFGELRHTIEPYLDYAWIPPPRDLESGEVYLFDRTDGPLEWRDRFHADGLTAPGEWHGLRVGIRNTLLQHGAEGVVRTLLTADLYGACAFENLGGEPAGWRLAGWDAALHLSHRMRLDLEGEYDTRERCMRRAEARVHWDRERWRFSTGWLLRREPPNPDAAPPPARPLEKLLLPDDSADILITDGLREITDAWAVGFHTRLDLRDARMQEIGGFLQYRLDCLSFQLRVAWQPPLRPDRQPEEKEEYRVALVVRLRAAREGAGRDDLLGW